MACSSVREMDHSVLGYDVPGSSIQQSRMTFCFRYQFLRLLKDFRSLAFSRLGISPLSFVFVIAYEYVRFQLCNMVILVHSANKPRATSSSDFIEKYCRLWLSDIHPVLCSKLLTQGAPPEKALASLGTIAKMS
jgi:hypothetical protein